MAAPLHTSSASRILQAVPAIKDIWCDQVAQNWTSSCGEYPIFKALKAVYCIEYTAGRNEQSAA